MHIEWVPNRKEREIKRGKLLEIHLPCIEMKLNKLKFRIKVRETACREMNYGGRLREMKWRLRYKIKERERELSWTEILIIMSMKKEHNWNLLHKI